MCPRITTGEKLQMVLFSGAGQSGLEAAEELGRTRGIKFSNIVLLDTPVFLNSDLSNVERIHLFRGNFLNSPTKKIPSIGVAFPFLPNIDGTPGLIKLANFSSLSRVRVHQIDNYGHLDFIDSRNISAVVKKIRAILEKREE